MRQEQQALSGGAPHPCNDPFRGHSRSYSTVYYANTMRSCTEGRRAVLFRADEGPAFRRAPEQLNRDPQDYTSRQVREMP